MSKITLEPNNSGTGTFTIAAPNSNTNRTLTLPDEAGTALTDTTDLEPQVKTSLNATGNAPMFACRAFCNFNGTGTVSIRASGNVSSITDLGTGNYRVNFSTALVDDDYAANFTAGRPDNTSSGDRLIATSGFSTTSVHVSIRNSGVGDIDSPTVTAAIFR